MAVLKMQRLTGLRVKKGPEAILEKLQSMESSRWILWLGMTRTSGKMDTAVQRSGICKRRQLLQIRRWIFWINMYRTKKSVFSALEGRKVIYDERWKQLVRKTEKELPPHGHDQICVIWDREQKPNSWD